MDYKELSGCLIIEEGSLLLIYRPDEDHWEVPGGKVKDSESPTDAAIRECKEEIGVDVSLEKPFFSGEFQHNNELYLWHGYLASSKGTPEVQEKKFSDLQWFNAQDLNEINLSPNLEMIKPGLVRLLK